MPKSRITIVGTGIIGGSIGLALKKSKVDVEIVGHDKDMGVATRAQKRGAIDVIKWNLIDACDGAGLIVLAIPLDGVRQTLDAVAPHLKPGVILTDTAMTKTPVLERAAGLPNHLHFIGGDPILKSVRAATETGIDAADANLFQDATYCLVPSDRAAPDAVNTLANFVSLLGAKPYFIDAVEHDGLVAATRHLPALVATALAAAAMDSQGSRERGKVASSELIAATALVPTQSGSARLELMAQREHLVRWIDTLTETLTRLREVLERKDSEALGQFIETTVARREQWLKGAETKSAPVDWEATQFSISRLFLGGLADRGKPPDQRGRGR